jgi:hypothetical protein
VPGLSDNIRVRSILGRFLEHSRIVRFGHGDEGKPLYLIGSADWMPRNLDRRIEVLVPVSHPKHQAWLDHVYEIQFADDVVRWEMDGEGSWQRRGPEMFTDAIVRGLLPLGRRSSEAVIRPAFARCSPLVHLGSGLASPVLFTLSVDVTLFFSNYRSWR